MATLDDAWVNGNETAEGTTAILNESGAIIPAGTLIVLAVGWDNTTATAPTSTISTIGGVTPTAVVDDVQQGASSTAGSGVFLSVWVALTTSSIAAGGTLATVTWSASCTGKRWAVYGFSGMTATLRGTTGTNGSAAGTPAPATSGTALATNDVVIGVVVGENSATPTADADTLNGSWSAVNGGANAGGAAATNVALGMQWKQVTATGVQTYNGVTAGDAVGAIFALVPAAVSTSIDATLAVTATIGATGARTPMLARVNSYVITATLGADASVTTATENRMTTAAATREVLVSTAPDPITWKSGVFTGGGGAPKARDFGTWRGRPVGIVQSFSGFASWAALEAPTPFLEWQGTEFQYGYKAVLVTRTHPNNTISSYAACVAGDNDAHWVAWATWMITNGFTDCFATLNHEYNLDNSTVSTNPGGVGDDTANMRDALRRFVTVVRGVSVGGVFGNWKFILNPSNGTKGTVPDPAKVWPGDDYMDEVWLDQYDRWDAHDTATPAERWNQIRFGLNSSAGGPRGVDFWQAFCRAGATRNASSGTGTTTATRQLGFGYREWGMWDDLVAGKGGGGDNPEYFQNVYGTGGGGLRGYVAAGGTVSGEILFNNDSGDGVKHQIWPGTGGDPTWGDPAGYDYTLATASYLDQIEPPAGGPEDPAQWSGWATGIAYSITSGFRPAPLGVKTAGANLAVGATVTANATVTKLVTGGLAVTATLSADATVTRPVTGGLAVTATVSATAALFRSLDASLAVTASISAAAVAGPVAAVSLPITATLSATALLGVGVTATLPVTATIGAALGVSRTLTASLPITASLVAGVTGGAPIAAAPLVITATISATALRVGGMTASLPVTATIGTTLDVARSVTAALPITATVTAGAITTALGTVGATLAVTATSSAAMLRTVGLAATLGVTATTSVALAVTQPLTAALAITATATATAALSRPLTASLPITATINAGAVTAAGLVTTAVLAITETTTATATVTRFGGATLAITVTRTATALVTRPVGTSLIGMVTVTTTLGVVHSRFRWWNGTAWVPKPGYQWDGTKWVPARIGYPT